MARVELDKSFAVFSDTSHPGDRSNVDAEQTENLIHESGRLQLNTYQAFVQNLMNPRSDRRSLLLVHMTGTGKTITALATATEYVRQHTPDSIGSVVVLGFTKDIFRRELLAHPEFKFVSADEASELKQLERGMHASDAVAEQYIIRKQRYHRRLINRNVHTLHTQQTEIVLFFQITPKLKTL
jgi:superfamily II DNA or RNA helicase